MNFCIKGPSLSKVAGTNELGSLIALANLHKRYDAWLQSRLIGIFGRSSAEDIAQQTWLAIARSDAAMSVQNPKAFLLTVARNAAYDDVRKGRRVSAADDIEIGSLSVPDDQLEAVFLRQVILSLPQPLRDRIVVGEMRDGAAALETLKSWNTGHPGGLSTIHANSAGDVLRRIEDLIAEVSARTPQRAIAQAVDRIVHIRRTAAGRTVEAVLGIEPADDDGYAISLLA